MSNIISFARIINIRYELRNCHSIPNYKGLIMINNDYDNVRTEITIFTMVYI